MNQTEALSDLEMAVEEMILRHEHYPRGNLACPPGIGRFAWARHCGRSHGIAELIDVYRMIQAKRLELSGWAP